MRNRNILQRDTFNFYTYVHFRLFQVQVALAAMLLLDLDIYALTTFIYIFKIF